MARVKVRELQGEALNYAVAVALGYPHILVNFREAWGGQTYKGVWLGQPGGGMKHRFNPVGYWGRAGKLIVQEGIDLVNAENVGWDEKWMVAYPIRFGARSDYMRGDDPLVLAMRCIVMKRKGDEVDVPGELLK